MKPTNNTKIILGIDPGSRSTGYGLIYQQGSHLQHLEHGYIHCSQSALHFRLEKIFQNLQKIIQQFKPTEVAIEQVFTCRNPQAALKLGQARGAALVATATHGLSISEYSARQIKQAVVGYGAASKEQVQHMVRSLLRLKVALQADAADALAIAICHANTAHLTSKINAALIKGKT